MYITSVSLHNYYYYVHACVIYYTIIFAYTYVYISQIEICGCENGGNCTTEGTTPSANPRILNCICPEGTCISITCTYNKTHI